MKCELDPVQPFSRAGLRLLVAQQEKLLRHEAGTVAGEDIEELHEMRVAARRVRAVLEIFEPGLPDQAEGLCRRVKRLGKRLGPVRDLDVLSDLLGRLRAEAGLQDDDATGAVATGLAKRREAAQQELAGYLESRKYRRLKARLAELLEDA